MELSFLSENIVNAPLKRGDETATLRVNIDAFTPEFFRQISRLSDSLEAKIEALKPKTKTRTTNKKQPQTKSRRGTGKKVSSEDWFALQATSLELQREVDVEFLWPHVLKGWDVTESGVPVELTKELLLRLPPRLVSQMVNVCLNASKTVKKTEGEAETLENTQDGSQAQDGSLEGLRLVAQGT